MIEKQLTYNDANGYANTFMSRPTNNDGSALLKEDLYKATLENKVYNGEIFKPSVSYAALPKKVEHEGLMYLQTNKFAGLPAGMAFEHGEVYVMPNGASEAKESIYLVDAASSQLRLYALDTTATKEAPVKPQCNAGEFYKDPNNPNITLVCKNGTLVPFPTNPIGPEKVADDTDKPACNCVTQPCSCGTKPSTTTNSATTNPKEENKYSKISMVLFVLGLIAILVLLTWGVISIFKSKE
jgi:hypothetical protein